MTQYNHNVQITVILLPGLRIQDRCWNRSEFGVHIKWEVLNWNYRGKLCEQSCCCALNTIPIFLGINFSSVLHYSLLVLGYGSENMLHSFDLLDNPFFLEEEICVLGILLFSHLSLSPCPPAPSKTELEISAEDKMHLFSLLLVAEAFVPCSWLEGFLYTVLTVPSQKEFSIQDHHPLL